MSDPTNDINWVQPQINYIPDHEEPKSLRERAAERGIETSGEDIDASTELFIRKVKPGDDALSRFIQENYPEMIEWEYDE